MNIFTDTDQMQEASNEFAALINDMRDVHHNLNNLINYLEPTWKGAAAEEYLNGLRQRLFEINSIIEALCTMRDTADERIRTAISIDRLESLSINNVCEVIGDTAGSIGAAIGSLFNW